jgi:hypothetical protein
MTNGIKDIGRAIYYNTFSKLGIAYVGLGVNLLNKMGDMPYRNFNLGLSAALLTGGLAVATVATRRTMRSINRTRKKLEDREDVPLDMAVFADNHSDRLNCYGVGLRIGTRDMGFDLPELTEEYYDQNIIPYLQENFDGTPESLDKAIDKLAQLGVASEVSKRYTTGDLVEQLPLQPAEGIGLKLAANE